jgi:hypothetical protein
MWERIQKVYDDLSVLLDRYNEEAEKAGIDVHLNTAEAALAQALEEHTQ